MARRKKKGEPELLIVSFCDIVTVTTAAMFFAMLITIQEAVKIPVFKPTPRAKVALTPDKQPKDPVFFECRNDMVYPVDMTGLNDQVEKMLNTLDPGQRHGELAPFLKALQGKDIGNTYYTVDPKFLLVGRMALVPKADVRGETVDELKKPSSNLARFLKGPTVDKQLQYVVFLVRDDSFPVFRRARAVADKLDFDCGWELLGSDEPIQFGAGGKSILSQ